MSMNGNQVMSPSNRAGQSSNRTSEPRSDIFTQYPKISHGNIILNGTAGDGATPTNEADMYYATQSRLSKKKEYLQFNNQGFAQVNAYHAAQLIKEFCPFCRDYCICYFEAEGIRCQSCEILHRYIPPPADLWRHDPNQTEVKQVVSESATTIANKDRHGMVAVYPGELFNGIPLPLSPVQPHESIMRNESESFAFQPPPQSPDMPNQDGTGGLQYGKLSGTKRHIDQSDSHPCDRFNSPTRTSSGIPYNRDQDYIPPRTSPAVPHNRDLLDMRYSSAGTSSGVPRNRDVASQFDVPTRTSPNVPRNVNLVNKIYVPTITSPDVSHNRNLTSGIPVGQIVASREVNQPSASAQSPRNNIKASSPFGSHDSSYPPERHIVLNNNSPSHNMASYPINSAGPNNATRYGAPQIPHDIRNPAREQNGCFTANDLNGHGTDNGHLSLDESSIGDYLRLGYASSTASQPGSVSLEDNVAVVPDQTSMAMHSTDNAREIGTNTDPISNPQEHLENRSHENAESLDGDELVTDLKLEVFEILQEWLDPDMGKNWAHIASRHGWKNSQIKRIKRTDSIKSPFEYFVQHMDCYSKRDLFNDLKNLPRMDLIKELSRQGYHAPSS